VLQFDLHPLSHLDHIGLLATQHYNLGNRGDWFLWFRRGLQGVDARVFGIGLHYYDLHNWIPKRRHRTETEYHLASLLFNMDSVMECFVYMQITRLGYYQKRARIKKQPSPRDTKSVWYETWYVDPSDGQKKRAWQSSAEFVGEQESA
jgi:hypothetical protein